MDLQKFNKLLDEYNNRLSANSPNNIDFNALNNAVLIFFNEVIKLDKKTVEYYFRNMSEENVNKNLVEEYAFNYFILLTIKNNSTASFFSRFFPEYLEVESTPRSNWRVVCWLQIFIAWIIKPKPKLSNLADARAILNALRDIKHRISNTKNELLDVKLEMRAYKSLDLIEKKIIEPKTSSLIFISINDQHLIRDWLISCIQKLEIIRFGKEFLDEYSEEYIEIDTLLKYTKSRIKLLLASDEKTELLNKFTKLQDFVFKKEFSLFEEKIYEIKKFIKGKINHKNADKIGGIYHLLQGIKLRLKLLCKVNDEIEWEYNYRNLLSVCFKKLLNLRMDKIQLYYEVYRKNLDQQVDLCYGNRTHFHEVLNKLEAIIYTDKNLFFHTSNQAFSTKDFASLSASLEKMQRLAEQLGECAKNMDPKSLENDVHALSQFILAEILFLNTELEKEIKAINFSMDDSGDEDDEWDDASDISETPDVDQLEQTEVLNSDEAFIDEDNQSDSGISEHEVEFKNLSEQSRILTYESSSAFFVRSADQAGNSDITRSSFRHSYHG